MIRNDRIRQLPKHVNKACANELMNSVQKIVNMRRKRINVIRLRSDRWRFALSINPKQNEYSLSFEMKQMMSAEARTPPDEGLAITSLGGIRPNAAADNHELSSSSRANSSNRWKRSTDNRSNLQALCRTKQLRINQLSILNRTNLIRHPKPKQVQLLKLVAPTNLCSNELFR